MKKILCLLIFIILISCNKNNQKIMPQDITSQNVNTEDEEINSQESIPQEISTENIEINIDDYKFNVGNISMSIPNNYAATYVIESDYVRLDNWDTTKLSYIKTFRINIFRKDGNYEEYGEYGVSILPALIDYLNGTSQKGPDIYVASMRRSKFKGINVCETLTLSRYVIDDIEFEHQIIFTDDEYCYRMRIYFGGLDFDGKIRKNLSDYFDGYNWIMDKQNEIYIQFMSFQKMPEYIEKLYAESISVFSTLKFNEVNE